MFTIKCTGSCVTLAVAMAVSPLISAVSSTSWQTIFNQHCHNFRHSAPQPQNFWEDIKIFVAAAGVWAWPNGTEKYKLINSRAGARQQAAGTRDTCANTANYSPVNHWIINLLEKWVNGSFILWHSRQTARHVCWCGAGAKADARQAVHIGFE